MNKSQLRPEVTAGDLRDPSAMRTSAKGVLDHVLRRAEQRTEAIAILTKVIPWKLLSPHDEGILWRYFSDMG